MADSLFLDLLGKNTQTKIIDFFLTYPDFDYTKSYVAKEAGVSRVTIETVWKKLVKAGIIVKSRTVGKIEMWALNREGPKVKVLMRTAVQLSLGQLESLKNEAVAAI